MISIVAYFPSHKVKNSQDTQTKTSTGNFIVLMKHLPHEGIMLNVVVFKNQMFTMRGWSLARFYHCRTPNFYAKQLVVCVINLNMLCIY